MKRKLIKVAVLLLLLLPASSSAKESWTSVHSQNFVVIGNAGESEVRKVAIRLELFRQIIALLSPKARIETPVPTTVIIFKSDSSFRPFKPQYKGKTRDNVAGYFLPGSDINYIALTTELRGQSPYEVIFHEYEHFIVENNLIRAPLWLNEGLAEFYSTFETSDDDQKVLLGKNIGRHLYALRERRILPLKILFAVNHKSPEYNQNSKVGIFYAESWALVHYLVLGNNRTRQAQFTQFINQLNTDMPLEESFRQSFQTDYKGMEDELRSYVSKLTFPAVQYNLKNTQLDVVKEMQSASLSEAEAQYYMGDLLLHGNRLDEAEERLQKSMEMDANFASSRVSLGILRLRQQQFAEARKLLQSAIAIDSRNYLAHSYYADVLSEDKQYEEAIKSYKQSIALKPDAWKTHAELGDVYLRLGRDTEAIHSFKQALRLAPRNPSLYRNFSYDSLRMGRGTLAAAYAAAYLKLLGWRDEHSPYLALAAYFGKKQAHATDAAKILDEAAGKLDTSAWPYPVIRYLQQAIKADELLKQATDNDKLTEAHAYIGMEQSLSGKRDDALMHLRWVKENGNKGFIEYPLALAELSRIERSSGDSVK